MDTSSEEHLAVRRTLRDLVALSAEASPGANPNLGFLQDAGLRQPRRSGAAPPMRGQTD
jgi:hypothetical protein